jgi:hypothetical protein
MSWLSEFVSAHGDTLLYSALAGALGWIGINFVGKPILALREKIQEALQAADRYAYIEWVSSEESVVAGRRALFDVASSLRAISRTRNLTLDLYCRCLELDLELASKAIDGLGTSSGNRGMTTYRDRGNSTRSIGAYTHTGICQRREFKKSEI